MFQKENLKGASIDIDFCGLHLQSPFILTSGPLCYGAEGLIRGHRAGCGGHQDYPAGGGGESCTPHGGRQFRFPHQLREVVGL